MIITNLQTNRLTCPMGFELSRPLLSWTVAEARGRFPAQARIQVSSAPEEAAVLFDTGLLDTPHDPVTGRILSGPDNLGWPLPMAPAPRTRYFWRVHVLDDAGDAAWSDWTWFETAKAPGEAWAGRMIASPFGPETHPVFHHVFRADRPVNRPQMVSAVVKVARTCPKARSIGEAWLVRVMLVMAS